MIWAQIPDYPDYEVSTEGHVRRLGATKCKLLTPSGDYLVTGVLPPGSFPGTKADIRTVHFLVLSSFLPNPALWHYKCIDHINNDGTDNRLVNLRWSNDQLNAWNRNTAKGWQQTRNNRYNARIGNMGRIRCLGTYDTPEAAHARYLEERERLQHLYDPTNKGIYMDAAYYHINGLLRGGCNIS